MTNLKDTFQQTQIEKLTSKKRIPTFRAGDTIKVTVKIIEGDKSRLQTYEGMCISRKNKSINSNFTVRKISHGEGVERVFPLFSPNIDKIEVIRKGDVRRAKLYYLRERTGKSARIADKDRGDEVDQFKYEEKIVEANDELKETNTETSQNNDIQKENIKETKSEDSTQVENVSAINDTTVKKKSDEQQK